MPSHQLLDNSEKAERRVAIAANAWSLFLESECRDRGVYVASDVIKATARRRMAAAESAAKANSRFDFLQSMATDSLVNARKREAVNFVIDRFGEESAHKTVCIDGERVPIIFLRSNHEAIWRAYILEYGARGALSRSCFLYSAFLPSMKVMTEETCLCGRCIAGGTAIEELAKLLTAPVITALRRSAFSAAGGGEEDAAADPGATLCKQLDSSAKSMERDLELFSNHVYSAVHNDPLRLSDGGGDLSFEAITAVAVPALDALSELAPQLAEHDDSERMLEWIEEVHAVEANLNAYKQHIAGRSWQNARVCPQNGVH